MNRFTPFTFKNGKTARNRVVVPPMASQTADSEGRATAATLQHYQRLSESGAGIVFVEYSFIHSSGRGELNQLGVDSDDKNEGLAQVARVIHQRGGLAGLQIVHVGGKSTTELTGGSLMGPSPVTVPVKGWTPDIPAPMSEKDIENWMQWFFEAARRAHATGFDFVEIHAAHGYGINQWLSPVTNHRSDSYGGGIKERGKLLLQITEKIKKEIPSLLLAVRLPAQDHFPQGLTFDEMEWVVGELETLGVDLIDVSSGIGGWRRPDHHTGQGYLVNDAARIKKNIRVPVIGVGGIETGEFIDDLVKAGKVDFAAVGRAILKDPKLWGIGNLIS